MPDTPNFALPYPLETDPADVPADMQDLATAVDDVMVGRTIVDAKGDVLAATGPDTLARVPVGADGQVLGADSTQPSGVKWVPLGGAYVPVTLPDAKGDLFGATGPDTPARVPVGSDGQILQADSAQALGVKWAAPPVTGIPPTIVDAKGDILVGSANDTPARLPVGADGQMIYADSTQALGLKWAAAPAGGAGGGIDPTIFDAKGDVLIASAPDTPARLPVGSNGQVLTADPTAANGLRYGERIDYENVYAAETPYQPGDVVTYQGVTYLCVNPATGQTPPPVSGGGGGGAVAQMVTTLPASPYDTQEVILVDSLTAPTYQWHLRYVAAKASNKWIYLGGSPASPTVATAETTSNAPYGDLTTVGPDFTLPVAGDYLVGVACRMTVNTAQMLGLMSYAVGATAAADAWALGGWSMPAGAVGFTGGAGRQWKWTALAAGALIRCKYGRQSAGSATFEDRLLTVQPIAVGG